MNAETDSNGIAQHTVDIIRIRQPEDDSPNAAPVGRRSRLNLSPEKRLLIVEALTRYIEVLQTLSQATNQPHLLTNTIQTQQRDDRCLLRPES
jgi:hypothetical protein